MTRVLNQEGTTEEREQDGDKNERTQCPLWMAPEEMLGPLIQRAWGLVRTRGDSVRSTEWLRSGARACVSQMCPFG